MKTTQNDTARPADSHGIERTFVLSCLAHRLLPDHPRPTPPADLDWLGVTDLVVRHGLTGLFYVLGNTVTNPWPGELWEHLRTSYEGLQRWGEQNVHQVHDVLAALRGAGIPVMVLKGWGLVPTIYNGDHGQRRCGDIDILVPPEDAARAEHIMQDIGCEGEAEHWPGYLRRYGSSRMYRPPRDAATSRHVGTIDLHWVLMPPPFHSQQSDTQGLFERAAQLNVAGVDACVPSPEDHLVYCCAHQARHHDVDEAWFRYFEAAALFISRGSAFDWDTVARRAQDWRLVLPLQGTIAHIESLWPGIVPKRALATISSLQATRAERAVHHWGIEETGNLTAYAVLSGLTRPTQRWRFLLETAVPSPAYMRFRYGPAPGGVWPLLYLQRARIAAKYALLLARSPVPVPQRYVANPAVSCECGEDGTMLVNPTTGGSVMVNSTGLTLWDFLETPRTVDELAAHLVENYRGISPEQAEQDAAAFVRSLWPDCLMVASDEG